MHYMLLYEGGPGYAERRGPFRAAHLAHAWAAADRGELVLGGAFAEPTDGAALVFNCDSPAPVEAFANADPYVVNGVVTSWRVRPWATVVGAAAHAPLREG